MRVRTMLLVTAVATAVFVSLEVRNQHRVPSRPDGDGSGTSQEEPVPPGFGRPTMPDFLPPRSTVENAADTPLDKAPDPLTTAGAAILRRLGPLLAEVNDPEAFLDAAGTGEWSFVKLPREVTDKVLAALRSDDPLMRLNAALALSAIELEPEDLATLRDAFDSEIQRMKNQAEKNSVLGLAFALSMQGDRHGSQGLADALRSGAGDGIDQFRSGATLVLALTKEPESSAVLRELAAADADRMVRKHAVVGLGRIGGQENRTALAESLGREQDLEVRAWSALAMGRATPKGGDDGTLTNTLNTDVDGEVRAAAAYALGKAGGKSTVEALTTTFYREDHSLAKVGAVAGLVRRSKAKEFIAAEATTWLAETVRQDSDSTSRYYGVATFEKMPATDARRETLRHAAASDRSSWVRGRAVQAVVRTEGKAALPFLRTAREKETSKRVQRQLDRVIQRFTK